MEIDPQSTKTVSDNTWDDSQDINIPMEDLIVVTGLLEGISVTILKDDGCNTNIVSIEFFEANMHSFKWIPCKTKVNHSNKESNETATKLILGATLQIGDHSYRSNWLVANCRYDVLLGMPWHVENNPLVDYNKKTFSLQPKIGNIGLKSFRKKVSRSSQNAEVFNLVLCDGQTGSSFMNKEELLRVPNQKLRALLNEFEDVFQEELPPGLPPKREVDHEIVTIEGSKPPHRPLYQLSPVELSAMKDYVQKLLDTGKIRPSKSPYGAPLFFVKEKGKELRGVVDYRGLNRITKRNNAPIPRSDEMFDTLGEARVFSRMDMKTGFHQIRVKARDIEKTAFNTKYGQFEYLVMPMGLCNSPATFQSLMNRIFYDCIDVFLVVYMDDLLIFSKDESSHMDHLRIVLSRLQQNQLYISPKKCEFFKEDISFLGMIVGKEWSSSGSEKGSSIERMAKTKDSNRHTELYGAATVLSKIH